MQMESWWQTFSTCQNSKMGWNSGPNAAETLGMMSTRVEHGLQSEMPARARISTIYCRWGEKQAGAMTLNTHPKEVMEFPKILHRKLMLQCQDGAPKEVRWWCYENNIVDIEEQVDGLCSSLCKFLNSCCKFFFFWTAALNRCWTADRSARKGLPCCPVEHKSRVNALLTN